MSVPVTWDMATAVKRVQCALDGIDEKDGLRASVDVRARSVMVTNYAHALKHDLYPDQVKELIAIQADEDSECWEAMVIIESMALSGDMVEAERHVKSTIGNCPGKRKGRKGSTLMLRNKFVHDGIEVLIDKEIGNMQLKDAIDVMSEVLEESEDVIIKARQTYIRMMERNRQLWRVAYSNLAIRELLRDFMAYKYVYACLSLPECLLDD